MYNGSRLVRRRAQRVKVGEGAFALCERGRIGPLTVENLGVGGALLIGGAGWTLGETFELELRFDMHTVIHVAAKVLRLEERRGQGGVAARFEGLSADAEHVIQSAVATEIGRSRSRAKAAIVVVIPPGRGDHLREAITETEATPLFVPTFLDALRWLQEPNVLVRALIVDVDAEPGLGVEMVRWCAEEFPAVKRFLLSAPSVDAHRAPGERHDDYAILTRPVTTRSLAKALGCVSARRGGAATHSESPAER